RVYLTDMVSGALLGAAVARVLRLQRLDQFQRWLLLFGVMLAVSLARGAAAFGLQTSISDFRQYLFFFGVALYFSTFPPSVWLNDRIGRIWLLMTIPMMLLVSLRGLQVFTGIDLGVPGEKYGADAAIRAIDGPYVFFLASAFVVAVPAWLRRERARWPRWVSVLLLLFVVALDRRTVWLRCVFGVARARRTGWLAVLVGVTVVMLRDRQLGRRALVLLTIGAVLTAGAFVWLGGLGEGSQPLVWLG